MTISIETMFLIVTLFLALAIGGLCGLAWYHMRRSSHSRRLALLIGGGLLTLILLALTEPKAAAKTLAFLACYAGPLLFALSEADGREKREANLIIQGILNEKGQE